MQVRSELGACSLPVQESCTSEEREKKKKKAQEFVDERHASHNKRRASHDKRHAYMTKGVPHMTKGMPRMTKGIPHMSKRTHKHICVGRYMGKTSLRTTTEQNTETRCACRQRGRQINNITCEFETQHNKIVVHTERSFRNHFKASRRNNLKLCVLCLLQAL